MPTQIWTSSAPDANAILKQLSEHECIHCGESFLSQSVLARHILAKHTSADLCKFKCKTCNLGFHLRTQLENHLRYQDMLRKGKIYACDLCTKKYITKSSLINHRVRHFRSKSINCTICKKGFLDKTGLLTHVKIVHTGKEFRCPTPTCLKVYTSRQSLLKHSRRCRTGL